MKLDYKRIKYEFELSFDRILRDNYAFKILLYEIFIFGSAYLIGGFLRDLINKRKARDIDIIIDLEHERLLEIIKKSNIHYQLNRHSGIKLSLGVLEVDMWSIENNWAFKNSLVKLNDDDKLNSIAKGCFYNYDALVINLHTKKLNLKYYYHFLKYNQLDILQKSPSYKLLNPTTDANILRAFYLKKITDVKYSLNTRNYILNRLGELKDQDQDPYRVLLFTKKKYSKYETSLSDKDVSYYLFDIMNSEDAGEQLHLKL